MKKIQNINKTSYREKNSDKATKGLRITRYALMTVLLMLSFATPVLCQMTRLRRLTDYQHLYSRQLRLSV